MPLTKFDIVEGLEREIQRLNAELKKLKAGGTCTVQERLDNGSVDITEKFRDNLADCALQLHRLTDSLKSLHVS